MYQLAWALWSDDCGFILSAELVILGTVVVLGLVTAMVCVRDAVSAELTDVAHSFRQLDQSYFYSGMTGCPKRTGFASWTAGSGFIDGHLRTTGPHPAAMIENDFVPICPPVPECAQAVPAPAMALPRGDSRYFPSAPPVSAPQIPCQTCPPADVPTLPAPCESCLGNPPQVSAPLPCQTCPQGPSEWSGSPWTNPWPNQWNRNSRNVIPTGPVQVW